MTRWHGPARVLLAGLFCVACASSAARPSFPLADARQALQRREATVAGLRSMRAEARVDQRGEHGRIRGSVLMLIERDGRVRFDVMTQFGPIAILTSDGAHFAYADLREKRFLTGETCPQNIARLLGVPLSAADTARFLLGGTPVIAHTRASMKLDADGHYDLELFGADGQRQELVLAVYPSDLQKPPSQQRLYLVRSELWSSTGAQLWRVTYEDQQPLGPNAVLMPRKVHIVQPGADTLVRFKSIAENPQIPDDAFEQTPLPGLQEETASCD